MQKHKCSIVVNVHCLGICTMDLMSRMDKFPLVNSKNKSLEMKMCGGGNAANVSFDLFKMMMNDDDEVSEIGGCCTVIRLITKIGDDVIGKSIFQDFKELETLNIDQSCKFDTSGIIVASGCHSSFSYVMVTPSENSNEGYDRTIINTPLSDSFEFKELNERNNETQVDLLFLDGRYANVAIEYIDCSNIQIGYIVMECERMRFGSELKYFLELMTKSNVITLSEGFAIEYLQYYVKNIASSDEKVWIEECNKSGIDGHLLSLHLIFSLLKQQQNCKKVPNFLIQTLGSRGSLCMVKSEAENQHHYTQVRTLSCIIPTETVSSNSPQCNMFSFSLVDRYGTQHFYTIIHCQSYSNVELPMVDSTGAGDSFNAATLYTLKNFIAGGYLQHNLELSRLEKLLKFSSISALYCCSAMGARTCIIDSRTARKIWNEL